MVSKTKYTLDRSAIQRLFQKAGLGAVTQTGALGAGEYNAVYCVEAGGKEYVLKVAPHPDVPVLRYEQDMMATEVFWYAQIREHTAIRVPQVYFKDFDKTEIPVDYFIMEKLPGKHFDKMDIPAQERRASVGALAKMVAEIHQIKNDRFGYIQNGLHATWHDALRAMVQAVVNDAATKGGRRKDGERLLQYIDRYEAVLNTADCCMVNFDMWAPNILCERVDEAMRYAWIDPERSFWGDPIMDFSCLEPATRLAKKKTSLQAYNCVADKPVYAGRAETIRYAFAQGYLALIMGTERYFRYTPYQMAWWRNAAMSKMMFLQAFEVLKHG